MLRSPEMLLLLATAALATAALAADGPARVGPGTGDHPGTELSWPSRAVEDPFSAYRVTRACSFDNRYARFGPLPIRWSFDHELAASLALVAPMSLVPDAADAAEVPDPLPAPAALAAPAP